MPSRGHGDHTPQPAAGARHALELVSKTTVPPMDLRAALRLRTMHMAGLYHMAAKSAFSHPWEAMLETRHAYNSRL